jgi:membrane protease YdiL (CAAX protease family)
MRDALALVWAILFPSIMAWGYFVAAPAMAGGQGIVAAIYLLAKVIQFGFPAVYVGLTDRKELQLAWPNLRGLLAGLVFGVVVGLAAFGLYFGWLKHSPQLADTPAKILGKLQQLHCDSVAGFLLVAVFISVFHSLLEEYYWRWFVFGWLKRLMPAAAALVVASLGFMAHHVIVLAVLIPDRFLTAALPLSLCIAVGGGVWCWLYQRTGSLYAPWISHLLIDAAIMGIGFDLVRGSL